MARLVEKDDATAQLRPARIERDVSDLKNIMKQILQNIPANVLRWMKKQNIQAINSSTSTQGRLLAMRFVEQSDTAPRFPGLLHGRRKQI